MGCAEVLLLKRMQACKRMRWKKSLQRCCCEGPRWLLLLAADPHGSLLLLL
jgi:hypothetical protein